MRTNANVISTMRRCNTAWQKPNSGLGTKKTEKGQTRPSRNTWNNFQILYFLRRCTTVTIVTAHKLFISTPKKHLRQKLIHKTYVRVCGPYIRLTFTLVPICRRSLQSPYKVLQFHRPIICSNLSLPHCVDVGFFFWKHNVADCSLRKGWGGGVVRVEKKWMRTLWH